MTMPLPCSWWWTATSSDGREGGDRGGREALERQVDAEGELPHGDRHRGQRGDRGAAVENAEEDREVGGEQQRGTDQTQGRQDARDQAGPVHDVPQAQRVDGRRQALREQERVVVGRGQGVPGGDQGGRSAPAVPATSCRRVSSVRTLTTPSRMPAASRTREVTKPRAADSLCRLATGKSTTAVPTPAMATTTSDSAAHSTPVSLPAPRTKSAWPWMPW